MNGNMRRLLGRVRLPMYVFLSPSCGSGADVWLVGLIPPRHRHSTSQGRLRATEAIYQRVPTGVTYLSTSAHDDIVARECGMCYAHGSGYLIRTSPAPQINLPN